MAIDIYYTILLCNGKNVKSIVEELESNVEYNVYHKNF